MGIIEKVKGWLIIVCLYVNKNYIVLVKIYLRNTESFRLKISMEFKCSECSKSYSTQKSLNNHTRLQHGNPKQFLCTFCDYITFNKGHWETHIRSQHKNIKELCSGCGKQFSNQSNVNRHNRKLHCVLKKM